MTDRQYGRILTRVALGSLLLWFGTTGIATPETLIGYVPGWVGIDPSRAVFLNALLDTALGVLLLIGWQTRVTAAMVALHIAGIAASAGYNDVMARDTALALVAAAVAINGPDRWTLDNRKREER